MDTLANVTLDTNCIIDLEENNDVTCQFRILIRMHEDQEINLRIPATMASERMPDGKYASIFSEFKDRITAVGLGHVDILKPIFYYGIAYHSKGTWFASRKLVSSQPQRLVR